MEVPRTLYHTNPYWQNQPGEGSIVEEGDPAAASLMATAGTVYDDAEAKRLGLTDYLATHKAPESPAAEPEAKAVEQKEVEDKAVAAPAEAKAEESPPEGGVHLDAETRRTPGRRGA